MSESPPAAPARVVAHESLERLRHIAPRLRVLRNACNHRCYEHFAA